MSLRQSKTEQRITIQANNIGGIDESTLEITNDTAVLVGRNATNRTSMLQAIMAACGSENVTLKSDADTGSVEMIIGDETYTRTLERRNGTIVTNGEPLLDDPTLADRFAFLLESNEARRAITRGDDLREVLMGPIDTKSIETEIEELQAEKRELEEELEELESLNRKLPELEERKQSLETQIEEKRAKLEEKQEELEAADADLDATREDKSELEDKLEELREVRSSLEDVRYQIDTQEESISSLEAEKEELETELDDLPSTPAGEIEEIDGELERLRDQRSTLDSELTKLQSVIEFNQEMLEGTESTDIVSALRDEDYARSVTDKLVTDESVVCWTCGTEVDRDAVEDTLDRLRDLHQEKVATVNNIEQEIEELTSNRKELQSQTEQRASLKQRIEQTEQEIEERGSNLSDLRGEIDEYEQQIETLESEVEALEEDVYDELLELHREVNQVEFEIETLETDRNEVINEIAEIEDRLEARDTIEAQVEELTEEITELRTRIERLEEAAVEQFNDHMDEVLNRLEYRNIERVWIERVEREVRRGRRKIKNSKFDLHVIRETNDGTTYEDTIGHLSESEREVIGLVFGLAGYLVHEVYEECPIMILDSLEALDQSRVAILLEYIREYADYLVVSLLPEDSNLINDRIQIITNF